MLRSRYTPNELRQIKQDNANRLPPATACLGMYEYELKRAAEQESLFNSALVQTAKVAKEVEKQQPRLDSLERAVKACASHHDNERGVSLSAARSIDTFLQAFTTSDSHPKAVIKRSAWLTNELDQEAISTEDQVALTTILGANHTHQAKMELQQVVQHLRDDHVTITTDVLDLKNRVSKLEDLVRALTLQKSVAPDSPKQAQLIPITTSNGQTLDLSVPKGKPLVSHKSSRTSTPAPTNRTSDNVLNDHALREFTAAEDHQSSLPAAVVQSAAHKDDQLSNGNSRANEKPLPPVPAARAFPEAGTSARTAPLKDLPAEADIKPFAAHTTITSSTAPGWGSSTSKQADHKPAAAHEDAAAPAALNRVAPSPDTATMQPVQPASQPLQANVQSPSSVKRKGKTTKWKDPPIVLEREGIPSLSQSNEGTPSSDLPKTLFSLTDADKSAAGLHGPSTTNADALGMAKPATESHSLFKPTSQFSSNATMKQHDTGLNSSAGLAPSEGARKFGDVSKNLHANKKTDENKLPQIKAPQGTIFSTPDAMKNMLKSVAPQSENAAPKVTTLSIQAQDNTAPRAPVATFSTVAPTNLSRDASPAPSAANRTSQSSRPGRIVKSSAIRVVAETTPTPSIPSTPKKQAPIKQGATSPKPQAAALLTKTAKPLSAVPEVKLTSLSPTTSTVASTSSPLTPAAAVKPANSFTFKPVMSAQAPTFQPSLTFPGLAPAMTNPSASSKPSGGSFPSALLSKMTPEMRTQFANRMGNM